MLPNEPVEAGDSVLAEFGSAADAVQCAVEAQTALAEANSSLAPDRRISFRVGIHIGDVMVRAGDLSGDGVNIAARLQTLAKPGAVCISGATYDRVRKVLPMTFVGLGVQKQRAARWSRGDGRDPRSLLAQSPLTLLLLEQEAIGDYEGKRQEN
jgi:class 3 adenylate cyclase